METVKIFSLGRAGVTLLGFSNCDFFQQNLKRLEKRVFISFTNMVVQNKNKKGITWDQ